MNSLFNGVYNYLHNWTIHTIHEEYYNTENIKELSKPVNINTENLKGKPLTIFQELCKGNSVSVIAVKLGISKNTVRTHINTCCSKLGLQETGIDSLRGFILSHNNYDSNMT